MTKGDKGDIKSALREAGDKKRVEETKKKFLDTLALDSVGGLVILACQVTGIAKSYIYRLRNVDPEFEEKWDNIVDSADEFKGDIAEAKLMELVKAGNVSAVTLALKRYKPEKFGDKKITKSADPEGHTLSPEFQDFLKKAYGNKSDKFIKPQ